MRIDINKKYQTRSGLPVRIYATDGGGPFPIHGAVQTDRRPEQPENRFAQICWTELGSRCGHPIKDTWDLIPAKTWRAWRKNDAKPKFMVVQENNRKQLEVHCVFASDCDTELQNLFDNFKWFHEDGTETPCGACE